MDPITTPSALETQQSHPEKQSSWGLFIGLILILAIIVGSAYYAFTERIAPQQIEQAG